MGLEPDLNILEMKEEKVKGMIVKIIHVCNSKIRVGCPYCNKYTRIIHDKLRPIRVKYLDIAWYAVYLEVYKR